MGTVADLICHLQDHYRPEDVIAYDLWHPDDVIERASQRCIAITDDQAAQCIEQMDKGHDANIGYSWDSIDYYLDELSDGGGL